jgi:peptidoglycan/LPS O-acetylase OafA/YrhL
MATDIRESNRAPSLDVIRGYAALIVVIAHTSVAGVYKVEPIWGYVKWTPLRVIWAGHQAVIIFFMLSGFALMHMYESCRGNRYLTFAFARVARLYPPYIASLAVALAGYWLLAKTGHTWQKGWMNTAEPAPTRQMLIDHLKMIGSYDTTPINPPMWSIVHEMRISLLFPIIWFLTKKFQFRAVVIAVVISAIIGIAALAGSPTRIPWPMQDWLLTTHYATFFVIGAWFYLRRSDIVLWATSLTRQRRAIAWIVAFSLAAYPFDNPWNIGERIFGDLGSSTGAFLLMALSFTIREGRVFSIGHYLGKISFSLYLNHYVIMSVCMVLMYNRFGATPVWIFTIGFSVGLAFIMNKLVESPSQHLARWIRRKLSTPYRRVENLSAFD